MSMVTGKSEEWPGNFWRKRVCLILNISRKTYLVLHTKVLSYELFNKLLPLLIILVNFLAYYEIFITFLHPWWLLILFSMIRIHSFLLYIIKSSSTSAFYSFSKWLLQITHITFDSIYCKKDLLGIRSNTFELSLLNET